MNVRGLVRASAGGGTPFLSCRQSLCGECIGNGALLGRPPLAPLAREAALFASVFALPARAAISLPDSIPKMWRAMLAIVISATVPKRTSPLFVTRMGEYSPSSIPSKEGSAEGGKVSDAPAPVAALKVCNVNLPSRNSAEMILLRSTSPKRGRLGLVCAPCGNIVSILDCPPIESPFEVAHPDNRWKRRKGCQDPSTDLQY